MQYKFLQAFGQFNIDEVIETTDSRFGSDNETYNMPHILALVEAKVLEEVKIDNKKS